MEHGTKDPRVRGYAKTYGVPIEKLIALEKRLLGIPHITEVDFDASALESKQLCVLTGYDIRPDVQDYWERRDYTRSAVVGAAKENDLTRTGDRIEDYGEHFYFVFNAAALFEKE